MRLTAFRAFQLVSYSKSIELKKICLVLTLIQVKSPQQSPQIPIKKTHKYEKKEIAPTDFPSFYQAVKSALPYGSFIQCFLSK
jgi:hypothetical protein